jgi:hypothetical protein
MFTHPITEEVGSLTKGLKGKHSAGCDDGPECLIKQCIQLVKKNTNTYL